MAVVFFDSSALVKLCVYDASSRLMAALWDDADAVVASRLALVDVPAVLARGERTGVLSGATFDRALELWDAYARSMWLVATDPVLDDGAALVRRHALRPVEAIHLAAALRLGARGTVFACAEPRVAAIAVELGLTAVPYPE